MSFKSLMMQKIENFPSHEILDLLRSNEISKDDFLAVIVFRGSTTSYLVDFLRTTTRELRFDFSNLYNLLKVNLDEELGLYEAIPHENLKQLFWNELGITKQYIDTLPVQDVIEGFNKKIEDIDESSIFIRVGAILYSEGTIPKEFSAQKIGRDRLFPEKFVEAENDSFDVKKRKHRNSFYLNDHIEHDANVHFPDLLNALELFWGTKEGDEIIKGIEEMEQSRSFLYDSINNFLSR